ncbi:MAG: cell division topological specificity factor MinE [Chloroflexi bacterium]|jgi:cell division topological specificity factor|nr:cell division topological specificity factor MinE [Chloroflexota bacterium]
MNFFERLRGERPSAQTAKDRLQLVLVHDRADLPPGKLEALKDDLIAALSRHIEIDVRKVNISLTQDRHQQRLVADIPLAPSRARRRGAG